MNKIKQLYPPLTVHLTPPVLLKEEDRHLFLPLSYTTKESFLRQYKNVWVTSNGIVYKNLTSIKSLITCYNIDFKHFKYRFLLNALLNLKKKIVKSNEKFLLVFDNYSGPKGFAHWLCDGLTRLIEMKDDLSNYTLVVPYYFQEDALYKDTLESFDIKKKLIIEKNEVVKFEDIYICDHLAPTGIFVPENISKLRTHYWNFLDKKNTTSTIKKLYISRKNATRRFVKNENEIENILTEQGFEIVQMEDYSFNEQVAMVRSVEIVVSIHGAALSLIMFMQPGAKVLEFRKHDDNTNNIFHHLASVSDVNYHYLLCNYEVIKENANNFNLVVDKQKLNSLLKEI